MCALLGGAKDARPGSCQLLAQVVEIGGGAPAAGSDVGEDAVRGSL